MNFFHTVLIKLRLNHYNFNDQKTFINLCFLVPLLFGFISLCLGADANWDLTNYHVYNPFAFLNGKLTLDFAVAGTQTYFNPLLDVPYYFMTQYLPAPLIGFIMGTLHGLNFTLLAGICYQALPNLPAKDRFQIPLLLATSGMLTANFLSSIGNTMGDNSTSLFILSSLFIVMFYFERLASSQLRLILLVMLSGLLAGVASGLKPTNTVYALAICCSFFTVKTSWIARVRLSLVFGIGVLLAMGLTSGFWWHEMWINFGNPIYPQFSSYFPNPLTQSIVVLDASWRPKNLVETLFWPFIFSIFPKRVGQLGLHQIIWAVAYVLFCWWLIKILVIKFSKKINDQIEPRALFMLAVVTIGFVLWMKIFSIQRYLVSIEVCLPLVIFILLMQISIYDRARKLAINILTGTTAIVLLGGVTGWGHASWSEKMFRLDLPPLNAPEKTTVVLMGGEKVFGWIATQFPVNVAFTQVQGNFPEAMPAYANKIHAMEEARGGSVYTIIQAEKQSSRVDQISRIRNLAAKLNITDSDSGCASLQSIALKWKLHLQVTHLDHPVDVNKCAIEVLPSDLIDTVGKNKEYVAYENKKMLQYGYSIDASSCKVYSAFIGSDMFPFQWCQLRRSP